MFSESGREECSSCRNDAPGLRVLGAKLRLHQVFWSHNLAFQSQNATMRPDFSSPVCMDVCHRGHYESLSRCRLVGSCVLPGEDFFT